MLNIKDFESINSKKDYMTIIDKLIEYIDEDNWQINSDLGENCYFLTLGNIRINILKINNFYYFNIKHTKNLLIVSLFSYNLSYKLKNKLKKLFYLVDKRVKEKIINYVVTDLI